MTWPNWSPGPSYSQVRLVDVPPIADQVLPGSRGLGELRSEPLDPTVHGDVIDLDPALREELFDVSVGKSEPQVPPDRQGDDLRREPEPSEGRGRGWTGARVPVRSHGASLPDAAPRQLMQQCPVADPTYAARPPPTADLPNPSPDLTCY